jgi:hypothetical protein
MGRVITIDANELHKAAPRVTELHLKLVDSATAVGAVNFGVEMPPGVRGRVIGLVDAAQADISAAADQLEGMGEELARRAGLAELADKLGDLSRVALAPLAQQLSVAGEYHRRTAQRTALRGNLAGARHNRSYQATIERVQRGLTAVGRLATFGPATVENVTNPYTSTDRKIGNSVALGGSEAALTALTKVAISRAPFVVGGPIGIGIGVAWTVLDYKFHLSDRLSDGATWAVDKVGDGAQWFDDHALDPAGDAIADGADAVTPWDGFAPW